MVAKMITKSHTLEIDTITKPWPPDADLPTPRQDLDGLYATSVAAYDAYIGAVRQWLEDIERQRLQSWKTYHDSVGWPKNAEYKTRLETGLASFVQGEPAEED